MSFNHALLEEIGDAANEASQRLANRGAPVELVQALRGIGVSTGFMGRLAGAGDPDPATTLERITSAEDLVATVQAETAIAEREKFGD